MNIKQDSIKYDSKNNLIIVKSYGTASKERMVQDFNQVLKLSEIENCKNVLIDALKITKLPTIAALHSIGTEYSQMAVKLSEIRVAFTISDELSNDFGFLDNVLANRGVHFQIFKNVDDAKDWLLSK